jgi:class 3 adenylate cyclase
VRGQVQGPRAETATKAATPAATALLTGAAEWRQLALMFCDLVGSTALWARLDPEDMRRVIRAYQDDSSGVVARCDGFVAKFMGDGILAYFRFPVRMRTTLSGQSEPVWLRFAASGVGTSERI